MTKHLRFLFVMLLAMIWSAGWAAVGDTYQKVTSESELSAGDIIVFASDSKNMAMAGYNGTSRNKYYEKVDVAISEGVFDYVEGLSEFKLGGQKGSWTFRNLNDDSYLLGGTKSNLSNTKSIEANNKASLTFEKDNVKVEFGTSNLYLCLNSGATRFACYGAESNQISFTQIYKLTKKDSRKDSEIAFSSKSYEAKITDKDDTYHSYVTLNNPNNLSVTYASSKTDVAEVNAAGEVMVLGLGTTTISATFAGDDTYKSATVSYELTVVDPNVLITTFTSGVDKGSNSSSSSDGDEIIKNGVKISCSKTALGYGTDYRFYVGADITISVKTGFITKIIFDGGSKSKVLSNLTGEGYSAFGENDENGEWIGNAREVNIKNNSTTKVFVSTITVYVSLPSGITLDETAETPIEAKTGVNVTLKRSMVANEWNTICLPFDVSKEQAQTAFGEGVKIAELNANSTGNTLSFNSVEAISATKPYLIKPSIASPADGYNFNGVTIKDDGKGNVVAPDPVMTKGLFGLVGIYNKVDVTEDIKNTLFSGDCYAAFLGAGDKIYKAGTGMTKGFRAYFAIPKSASASALRVVIDGTATSIKNIDSEVVESNAPVYNLQGQRVDGNNLTPGIYVKAGKKFVVK